MPGTKESILVVDDDSVVREVLSEHLFHQGYEVITASDGEQAVALAIQHKPDLIVSDIMMPKMDGWDLCQALRLMPSTRNIPFVFLTSLDKTPEKILGFRLGADDYLTKPFSPREVAFKVRAIIKRVAERQQLLKEKEAQTDSRFLLPDLIEYLRHTQRSGLVAVTTSMGKGVLSIKQGNPQHASFGSETGETAVFQMFKSIPTKVKYIDQEYPELKQNIDVPWETFVSRIFNVTLQTDEKQVEPK